MGCILVLLSLEQQFREREY